MSNIELDDDPIQALHDADRARQLDSIGEATHIPVGGNASDAGTNGTAQRGDGDGQDSATARTDGPSDLQSILGQLADNPAQADAVRRIFADNSRLMQERKQAEGSLETVVKTAVDGALREQQAMDQGLDPEDPMAMVTPEQESLFERLLEKKATQLGYVRNDDLKAQEQQSQLAEANKAALEQFGDELGLLDSSGSVVLSDTAREAMTPVYQRLLIDGAPPPGLNYGDLMKIANFDKLIADAEERGRTGQVSTQAQRVARVQRAQTERPGANVTPQVNIRGEKGSASDKRDKVLARAMALAKQQLRRT